MAHDDHKKKLSGKRVEQIIKTIRDCTIGDVAVIDKLPEIEQIHLKDLFTTPKQD